MMQYLFALFLFLIGGCSQAMLAQERVLQHRPFIDERRWNYGFYIGVHDQSLKLHNNGYIDPATSDQWISENDRQNFGLSVGILGNWRLSRHLSLRLTPGLHFGSKHFTLRNLLTNQRESQELRSTYVALPAELKVAAPRFNNYRPYLTFGFHPMLDLTLTEGKPLRTRPFQSYVSLGLGCDFYLPFFKLNPELKFLFGLHDVLDHRRTDLTDAQLLNPTLSVSRATPAMVVLSLYFE